ncbi:MAG: primosomal protein N' [Ignavibacteriae bacterium]|nr:primosomal protein N' [Ignavibacteriota bacterium]NOG99061.1 primosomal protein N' [Ignavibacteriota bacterium]
MYAQIVFPLPFRNSFTYKVPPEFKEQVQVGVRVVVSFGRRILTGFVIGVSETTKLEGKIKPIQDVLDEQPIFNLESLKFYEWLAEYYLSSLGEALRYSVPYGTEVESKRTIVADTKFCDQLYNEEKKKTSVKAKLLNYFADNETARISTVQRNVGKKNIYSQLRSLEKAGAISILNQISQAKVRAKKLKFVKLAVPAEELSKHFPELEKSSPKQVVILLELVSNKAEDYQLSLLLKKTKTHQASINSLVQKGLVTVFDKEVDRVFIETYQEKIKKFELTETQNDVIDKITDSIIKKEFKSFLLHGVTGSGKTQVYIELTKKTLSQNQTVIILVPEISLTPQITSRFYNNFGDKITVLHSRMSLGERYDSWRGIIAGKYSVVIGPRSALFAPLKNIGLIVIDEEHDGSYKQFENIPRYHARDAGLVKATLEKCPILLGSATPSIESMFNAKNNKHTLLELKERVDDAKLPRIRLVDVSAERKQKRMESIFSKTLLEAISERLKKNEGVILLQNRRGFATQIYCEDCGEIEMCPDCSVSMVHHISKNILKCHYCGIIKKVPKACSNCGSIALKFFGTGTQRVEDELEYFFPEINIERVDSDSVSRKGALGLILNRFRNNEIDMLVGTQIVAKGLDFSHVTLVGVISAETTLWLPDFRADERTFQLLTQVSGRAGRSKVPGEVIIQTENPKHFVLQKVYENNYNDFYEKELQLRKKGEYPPFTRTCLIESKDEKEANARGAVEQFYKFLTKYGRGLIITPPAPAIIERIKNQYRYQILVKSKREFDTSGKILRKAVLESFIEFNQKSRFRNVRLTIDIDPQSIV